MFAALEPACRRFRNLAPPIGLLPATLVNEGLSSGPVPVPADGLKCPFLNQTPRKWPRDRRLRNRGQKCLGFDRLGSRQGLTVSPITPCIVRQNKGRGDANFRHVNCSGYGILRARDFGPGFPCAGRPSRGKPDEPHGGASHRRPVRQHPLLEFHDRGDDHGGVLRKSADHRTTTSPAPPSICSAKSSAARYAPNFSAASPTIRPSATPST